MNEHNNEIPAAVPVALPYGQATLAPPERKAYLVTRIFLILYMLPAVGRIVVWAVRGNANKAGEGAGALILMFIVWGLAILVWRIASRSNLAYNLTLCVCLGFLMLGTFAAKFVPPRVPARANPQLARFEANAASLKEEVATAAERGESVDPGSVQTMMDSLEALVKSTTGEDQMAAKAALAALKQLFALAEPRDVAAAAFDGAGGIDASTMMTREALDGRIELIDALIEKQEPVRAYRYERAIVSELKKLGARPQFLQQIVAAVRANPQTAVQVKLFQADYDLYVTYRDLIVFLKDNFEDWSFDEASDMVEFATDEQVAEYGRLLGEVDRLHALQLQLMRN